jgi:hypothetical protein
MKVLAYKVPKGQMIGGANVKRPSTGPDGAFGNLMTVNSSKVEERKDDLLKAKVEFTAATNTVTATAKTRLESLAAEMPNPKADATIDAPGLTVTVKGADDAARKARFDAIKAILTGKGMAATRIAFVDGGAGDGAEVVVGTGAAQTSVAHESGHMFGLDDEYIGSTAAYGAGKKTEHTDFVEKTTGLKGAMHAKSDSIMSEGRIVRPHHYATFLDALRVVSGIQEWDYGPGISVTPMTGTDPRSLWGEPMGPF